jgi:hypothetical protein
MFMTASWLRRVTKGEKKKAGVLDTYFAANEENSSCAMLEAQSFDWMSFSASSLIFSIPSFSIP